MTCNRYLIKNEKCDSLQDQMSYFDEKGRLRENFCDVGHIEVDNNLYKIAQGTIFDQYVYMIAVVEYLKRERYLTFSNNDVLYFCCREFDLCRGSQALARGLGTSEFRFDRFFVRQYISLFKLNYDLFFSLYQYLLQDYHNDICCDMFLEDKSINEMCDEKILDQFYDDIPPDSFLKKNGDNDRIILDGYDVSLGYQCFFDYVVYWNSVDEPCQLNVHSGFRNCRGDLKEYKMVSAPWDDYSVCHNSLSSLFGYNNLSFKCLEINVNILVYDYRKNDFVINVEDQCGVCSVHPISFKRSRVISHKIRIFDFKERFIINVFTSPFLGSYQISYSVSLQYYNKTKKKKEHVVDHYMIKSFFKYDEYHRDLPYDYKIFYYDMLGENCISFCRPLISTRSVTEQKRFFLSLYWSVCKDFFKGDCLLCCQEGVRMILLNCEHSVCYRCIYRITHEHRDDFIKCPFCRRTYYFPDVPINLGLQEFEMYNCGICLQVYSFISNRILKFPQFFLEKDQFIDHHYVNRLGKSDLWICYQCRVAKDEMCDVCGAYKVYIFQDIKRYGFNGFKRVHCYSCHTNGRIRDVVEKEDLGSSY